MLLDKESVCFFVCFWGFTAINTFKFMLSQNRLFLDLLRAKPFSILRAYMFASTESCLPWMRGRKRIVRNQICSRLGCQARRSSVDWYSIWQSSPILRQYGVRFIAGVNDTLCNYTPRIYAEGYIVFVFPSVCSFIHHVHGIYHKVLHLRFSSKVYLTNHSSGSIHVWIMGTLEGLLPCHNVWSQDSCPRVGQEVKIWYTLKHVMFL